jgi:uncharacterized cupredoxin-like copper-binding protein
MKLMRLLVVLPVVAVAVSAAAVADAAPLPSVPTIHVELSKQSLFAITPTLHRSASGRVHFVVRNDGMMKHEFVVIRLRAGETTLPVKNGKASEAGWVGETGDMAAGTSKLLTLRLAPGRYVLMCNLPGHYEAGMHTPFTVA